MASMKSLVRQLFVGQYSLPMTIIRSGQLEAGASGAHLSVLQTVTAEQDEESRTETVAMTYHIDLSCSGAVGGTVDCAQAMVIEGAYNGVSCSFIAYSCS